MAQLSKQDVLGIIAKAPEGTSAAGIVAALREQGHTLEGFGDTTSVVRAHTRERKPGRPDRGLARAAGGFGGEVIGGSFGQPQLGAGAGGALAEMAAQSGEMGLPMGTLGAPGVYNPQAVLEAANEQMLSSFGGRALAGSVKGLGKLGTRMALKVTPEVAVTAIREGITATTQGLEKLNKLVNKAKVAEDKIVKAASGQGQGWVDTQAFARDLFDRAKGKVQGGGQVAIGELHKMQDDFLKRYPYDKLSPAQLLDIRRYWDNVSRGTKAMVKAGQKTSVDASKVWADNVSNHAREVLRTVVPEIADPGAYQKIMGRPVTPGELQGVKDSLLPIVKKGSSLLSKLGSPLVQQSGRTAGLSAAGAAAGAAVPGDRGRNAWEGALAGAALSHPAILSTLSLYLQNPALAQALQQAPRAIGGLMGGEEPSGDVEQE